MEPARSMLGQCTQLTWALRSGAHSSMALASYGRTRRRRWLALGAAALALDPVVARRLADPNRPRRRHRLAADVLDVLVWARSGDLRAAYLASVGPAAVEAGYLLGAGVDAVPAPESARPFPPARRQVPVALGRVAVPITVPAVAARLALRGRRPRTGPEELWGIAGVLSGFVVARARDRLQREAREEWVRRSRHQVALEAQAAEVRAATADSAGHSFKKVLVTLGYWGSAPCAQAAAEQMERPRVVVGAAGGMTLFDAALGIPIEPPEAGVSWLSNEQADELRAFLDRAEDGPLADGASLEVRAAHGTTVSVAYLGHETRLDHPAPRVESSLDPLPALLVYGAALKLLASLPALGGLPPVVTTASAACDLVAVRRQWAHRARAGEALPHVMPWALAGATVFDLALASGLGRAAAPSGDEIVPATHGTLSLASLLGHHWDALGRWRWPAAAVTAGLWVAGSVPAPGRTVTRLLADAAASTWALVAISGFAARVHAETSDLERSLEAQFAGDVQAARRDAVEHELARYAGQLALAERELDTLGDAVPADIAATLRAECARMHRWLSDPSTRTSLASWS